MTIAAGFGQTCWRMTPQSFDHQAPLRRPPERPGERATYPPEIVLPRFYFHLRREGRLATDEEGSEHTDPHAALEEALQGARELVAAWVAAGDPVDQGGVIVTDETGRVMGEVRFSDVVRTP
jgi:hypothetical protein